MNTSIGTRLATGATATAVLAVLVLTVGSRHTATTTTVSRPASASSTTGTTDPAAAPSPPAGGGVPWGCPAVIGLLAVVFAVARWRHRHSRRQPGPVPAGFWDPDPRDAPQLKTWHWALFIHEPGAPASHALPHADGYLKAPDQDTASRVARRQAAASMPGPGWHHRIHIEPATPQAAAAWRHQHQPTQPNGPATTRRAAHL